MGTSYAYKNLQGLNKKCYTVGTLLGQGGEGDVYEVIGESSIVIKIYNDKKMAPSTYVYDMRSHMEHKLKVMVSNPVEQNNKLGHICISWPKDALYDRGRFVGYVMPRVDTKKKIYDVCRESSREKMFPNYTWQYSVAFALNLAWTVDRVHTKGYCIGDFNPNNILVDDRGNITLIDTDSFDVTDKATGEVYKCMVGVPEMLAPELQGRGDLRNPRVKFTKESDRFSLAVHVFNLLMNNCHPFNCTNIGSSRSSTSNEPIETGIAEGHFYYGRTLPAGIRLPITAPSYEMLPRYIRDLFERAFRYTAQTAFSSASKRPSADEWYQALKRMFNEQYVKCSKNPHHVYLASCRSSCPWCALKTPKQPTKPIFHTTRPIYAVTTNNISTSPTQQHTYTPSYSSNGTTPNSWKTWPAIAAVALILVFILSGGSKKAEPTIDYTRMTVQTEESAAMNYGNLFSQVVPLGIDVNHDRIVEDSYVSYDPDLEGVDTMEFPFTGMVNGKISIDGMYHETTGEWVTFIVYCDFYDLRGTSSQIKLASTLCGALAHKLFDVNETRTQNEIEEKLYSYGLSSTNGSNNWERFLFEHGISNKISLGKPGISADLTLFRADVNTTRFTILNKTNNQ